MNIDAVYEFVRVSEESSFQKAAMKLHVSASALSKHIGSLEKELGYTLLDRAGGLVTLTNNGTAFLSLAYEMIDVYERALSIGSRQEKNVIVVGLATFREDNPTCRLLREVLAGFRSMYPSVSYELRELHEITVDNFLGSDCDCILSIWSFPDDWKGRQVALKSYLLHNGCVAALVPESSSLSKALAVSLGDVSKQPIVIPSSTQLAHIAQGTKRLFVEFSNTKYAYKPGDTFEKFLINLNPTEPGVHIIPSYMKPIEVPGYRTIQIVDYAHDDYLFVKSSPGNRTLNAFCLYLEERLGSSVI